MSQIHEPGEVWHVGWDWYADMWYVEPPFDVELDEPIKWYSERQEAFDFVDEWFRTQAPATDLTPPPAGEPEQQVVSNPVAEPVRVVEYPMEPNQEYEENRVRRLAEYKARVGIK